MKTTIYVSDIECKNCTHTLNEKFKGRDEIRSFTVNDESIDFHYDDSRIKPGTIIDEIRSAGFTASLTPFERKSFSERWHDFRKNPHKYAMHLKGLQYAIWTFIILAALEVVAYAGFLKNIPNFLANYGWWILYLDISIVSLVGAIWYIQSYKSKVSCMVGMMIGMTVGMQTGMMLGAVVGATNGFFTGAMVGMLTGVISGIILGKCCGIMGVMEGMMAGVMGGTMGSMITVMMFTDHVLLFMPFYIGINVLILAGLSYMYFEEIVEGRKDVTKKRIDFTTFAAGSIVVTAVLIAIMLYGPKSALFAFGG